MSSYQDKLSDPRWQRRRLEIFKRDDWKCVECGRNKLPLHVHHLKYHNEPWDAPEEDLTTLCQLCHFFVHYPVDFNVMRENIRAKHL